MPSIKREERKIPSAADIIARVNLRSALADDYGPALNELAAVTLDAKPF